MSNSFLRTYRFIAGHPLGGRQKLRSLGRWLRWQVATRLLPHPIVVPFVGDTKLVLERGMHGATGNYYVGLHEFADMAFVLHMLRPGDLLIDVGANVGTYSVLAAGVAGARCLACEPIPATFKKLQQNLAINALATRVIAECVAIGRRREMLKFTADRGPMNRVARADDNGSTLQVPAEPLDDLCQRLLGDAEAIMWKVDVEGHEREVLTGAQTSLHDPRLQAVLLESNDDVLTATMREAGLQSASYEPFSRELQRAPPQEGQRNYLWVRDLHFVQARLTAARPFVVHDISV